MDFLEEETRLFSGICQLVGNVQGIARNESVLKSPKGFNEFFRLNDFEDHEQHFLISHFSSVK